MSKSMVQYKSLKTELSFVEPMISRLELDEANNKLENINDKLDEMYDLIEYEVKAKMKLKKRKISLLMTYLRPKI